MLFKKYSKNNQSKSKFNDQDFSNILTSLKTHCKINNITRTNNE